MITVVLLRGLPGCGKTTWARSWVAADPHHRIRVNRDDLRAMTRDGLHIDGVTEPDVIAIRDAAIRAGLRKGLDVVVDETALPDRTADHVRQVALAMFARLVIEDMRDVPPHICVRRDASRPPAEQVGGEKIWEYYRKFITPVRPEAPPVTGPEWGSWPGSCRELGPQVAVMLGEQFQRTLHLVPGCDRVR